MTYLAAVGVLESRFAEHKINEFTCLKAADELWRIEPLGVVLFGPDDVVLLLRNRSG